MQSWSVGILCYNEVNTIERVALQLHQVLQKMTDTFEILLVDDGSTDGSREIICRLQEQYPEVKAILHEKNKGIGGGLRSVYFTAKNENVVVTSADGQFDVTEFLPFPEVPKDSFISFYRKENTTYGLFRNLLSLFNKVFNRIFIGITLKDVNWTKIYKRADLAFLDLQLTSSLIESEISAKLLYLGRKVIEVESKYLPRTHGESKGGSMAIVKKAMRDMLSLVSVMRQFRKKQKKK